MDEVRYGRLCLLVLNTCPARLRGVIDDSYSRGVPSFEVFLNNNVHNLFHLRFRNCCCSNKAGPFLPLSKFQWDLLYSLVSKRNPHGSKMVCPCQYKAHQGITSDVLDVTYCCLLLTNICPGIIPHSDMETIRLVRNELIHASFSSIDEQTFNTIWTKVEQALLNISRLVTPTFEADTQNILQELKDRVIDPVELDALKQIMLDNRHYDSLREVRANVCSM